MKVNRDATLQQRTSFLNLAGKEDFGLRQAILRLLAVKDSDIRLLTYREMKQLFPDCLILKERVLGLTKSYVAVRL